MGTTWQKIEGRFLLGTSGSGASKQTGGSNTKTITQDNLPNVKLSVDSFSATLNSHYHLTLHDSDVFNIAPTGNNYVAAMGNKISGDGGRYYALAGTSNVANVGKTSNSGDGTTGTVNTQTSVLGSGTALDITPAYYTVHMWLRTS